MVIAALLATVVLNALGVGVLNLTNTEVAVAANYRGTGETLYAAEGAAECAIAEALRAASWNDLLSGAILGAYRDITLRPSSPSGGQLDLAALSNALQVASDAAARRGADNPRWRLMLFSPFSQIARRVTASEYVVAWVADDPAEVDGDPMTDSNDKLTVRAQAFGRQGAQRTVEATVARVNGGIGVLSWREVR